MARITSGLWLMWTALQHDGPNHLGFVSNQAVAAASPSKGWGPADPDEVIKPPPHFHRPFTALSPFTALFTAFRSRPRRRSS